MRKIEKPEVSLDHPDVVKGINLSTQLRADFKAGIRKPKTGSHYTAFKEILKKTHKNKCCYCEASLDRQHGDVEHFRPKQKVTDEDHRVQTVTVDGQVIDHPGYFWLAYDLDNLLLSCAKCNQASKDANGEEGNSQTKGKWNRFPLENPQDRACLNGKELTDESPLLIHPLFDTITDHLKLASTGILGAKTKKGEITIRVLDLNSENLVKSRRTAFRDGSEVLVRLITNRVNNKFDEAREDKETIWKIMHEEVEFSMAYWLGFTVSLAKLEQPDGFKAWLDKVVANVDTSFSAPSAQR
ncbi:hypothetical protein ACC755_09735 [Rhizobium ruizarguesonis]|uniref:hypothetical protein n=1 Tax=Rhizobium ruizarguesonis TaxID=2081791 RepID=UPI00102FFF4D|nr:hypothetical protein [Rhizobium ruizarguesonis]TAY84515.1 hypothetical protein ELH85_32320 [Rhizobium ruizarguesonis]